MRLNSLQKVLASNLLPADIFSRTRDGIRHALLATSVAIVFLMTTPLHATTPEEQVVIAPLQAVLDGIAQHDQALIRKQLLPGGMVTLLRNGQPLQLHFDAFVDRIRPSGTGKIEERIHDPLVRIDDDVAIIWTPYTFYVEGKVDHCGTDIVNLVRIDGHWLIANIADNSRKNCGAK
jgi:putative lumazine-binding protein